PCATRGCAYCPPDRNHLVRGEPGGLPEPLSSQPTFRRSSTCLMPGADHAARSAAPRSHQLLTLPSRVTVPSRTWTMMPLASISALRLRAFSMRILTSSPLVRGLSVILLETPTTPFISRTAR